MSSGTYPRVLMCDVYKETTHLKLDFFSNHPEIDNRCKEVHDDISAMILLVFGANVNAPLSLVNWPSGHQNSCYRTVQKPEWK